MATVEIILSEPARSNAQKALTAQGKYPGPNFTGPAFTSAKLTFKDGFAHVSVGTAVYSYPAHTVMRVKFEG